MKPEELLFENLYQKCIQEWPENLEFTLKSEISQTVEDHPDGYQIIKCEYGKWDGNYNNSITYYNESPLSDISDEICERYYNRDDEIIFLNFHDSIAIVIAKTSKCQKDLFLKDLDSERVKNIFEERIKSAINNNNLGWGQEDINLVHGYFRVNYPDSWQEMIAR
ncbi:MAG: hypothetical protein Q8K36_06930 [Alphaproteobacteria bacterium]|nr:hypothetical protein [Alphaproteobacteria bacterium]